MFEALLRCDGRQVPTHGLRFPTSATVVPSAAPKRSRPRVECADDLDCIPRSTFRSRADLRIVDDGRLTGEYVAAAAGTRTDRRLHPDTREWFAVVEGEVKVEIEGQPAITATRGSLVNIPRHTMYTIETVGGKPSLRFVVNVARRRRSTRRTRRRRPRRPGWHACWSETDLCTIVPVALLIGAVAVGASLIPAWRASRADPMTALKAE